MFDLVRHYPLLTAERSSRIQEEARRNQRRMTDVRVSQTEGSNQEENAEKRMDIQVNVLYRQVPVPM